MGKRHDRTQGYSNAMFPPSFSIVMASNARKKITGINENIATSVGQIHAYAANLHIINRQAIDEFARNIRTVDIEEQILVCQNTSQLAQEMNKLIFLEQKRRVAVAELDAQNNRGAYKRDVNDREK